MLDKNLSADFQRSIDARIERNKLIPGVAAALVVVTGLVAYPMLTVLQADSQATYDRVVREVCENANQAICEKVTQEAGNQLVLSNVFAGILSGLSGIGVAIGVGGSISSAQRRSQPQIQSQQEFAPSVK